MRIEPPPPLPFDLDIGTAEYYEDPIIYDHDFKWYKPDRSYYVNMVNNLGGPVLELGCGTGRLMYHWIKEGVECTGVDLGSEMVKRAKRKVSFLGKKKESLYNFKVADMKKVRLRKKYGVVVSAFNTMMHLYTYDDMSTFLKTVRLHMKKDGTFLFDILNPDFRWIMRDPNKRWARTRFKHPKYDTFYYYSTNHYYDASSQVAYIYIYHEPAIEDDGPTYMLRLAHRQYFPMEMKTLLDHHGFKIDALFGDFDGSELETYSPSQVYICGLK
jgi:SAM-dependent methyltransferase